MLFVMLLRYLLSFSFTSHSTANLLTVTGDRIARVLKISGATQTVVLDISRAFYRVWNTVGSLLLSVPLMPIKTLMF